MPRPTAGIDWLLCNLNEPGSGNAGGSIIAAAFGIWMDGGGWGQRVREGKGQNFKLVILIAAINGVVCV